MVLFGLNAAYALGNAVYLRHSAEEAKRTAVAQLNDKLAGLTAGAVSRKQVEGMVELIRNNREGAFLPFTQHPLFGAIALPTSGTGRVAGGIPGHGVLEAAIAEGILFNGRPYPHCSEPFQLLQLEVFAPGERSKTE